ncbi:hypothetical protein L1887_40662 [Cichorium endivia]|nr:hypothetical protein L1887_40662 [Cichorium endivia]
MKDCVFIDDLMTRYSVFEHAQSDEKSSGTLELDVFEADADPVKHSGSGPAPNTQIEPTCRRNYGLITPLADDSGNQRLSACRNLGSDTYSMRLESACRQKLPQKGQHSFHSRSPQLQTPRYSGTPSRSWPLTSKGVIGSTDESIDAKVRTSSSVRIQPRSKSFLGLPIIYAPSLRLHALPLSLPPHPGLRAFDKHLVGFSPAAGSQTKLRQLAATYATDRGPRSRSRLEQLIQRHERSARLCCSPDFALDHLSDGYPSSQCFVDILAGHTDHLSASAKRMEAFFGEPAIADENTTGPRQPFDQACPGMCKAQLLQSDP